MKICIAGGRGFIGTYLRKFFEDREIEVAILHHKKIGSKESAMMISNSDVLINLMGESIIGIWTKGKKKRIYSSRINSLRKLIAAMNNLDHGPSVFIQISGISLYDHEHVHDESSSGYGSDFITRVTVDWENQLKMLKDGNLRVAVMRLGLVLGMEGGIMKKVMIPVRLRIGFTIASKEKIAFIHIADVAEIMLFIIKDEGMKGIINAVNPEAISIYDFYLSLMRYMGCLFIIRLSPGFLKILIGEVSDIVARGQHVIPGRLLNAGYNFRFKNFYETIQNLMDKGKSN